MVRASQTGANPMPPQPLRLEMYWPGTVHVRGTIALGTLPAGATAPGPVQLRLQGTDLAGAVSVGGAFDIPINVITAPGQGLLLEARATSGALRFNGSVNLTMPQGPPASIQTTVRLEVQNPEAADPCPPLRNSARLA